MVKQKNSHDHEGSLIHVRFGFEEALNAKKGILRLQMAFLKVMKSLERYKELRIKEFALKDSLAKKSKEAKSRLKHLNTLLPKAEIPKIARKNHDSRQEKPRARKPYAKNSMSSEIENELLEIQKRLDLLQSQNI